MKPILRSALFAAAVGGGVALALVAVALAAGSGANVLRLLVALLVLLCPPWEVLWGGVGEPHNLKLWASLTAFAIASNALIYAPIGLAYGAFASVGVWAKRSAAIAVALLTIGLGHLYFIR